jgi:hypothetical protein
MQPANQFDIENWKPFRKNTLQGFLDLILHPAWLQLAREGALAAGLGCPRAVTPVG